ncbi:hypothetical protein [Novosphingobium sp. THN1]|uniref:hypothetical protein n=1 Tax=Novosphingobium sp. THN1 TaxID=1016987 RepID=UPI0026B1315E
MKLSRTILLGTLGALALAGCGNKAELKLAPDQTPPPIPYGREVQPGADDLLKTPRRQPLRATSSRVAARRIAKTILSTCHPKTENFRWTILN